MIDVTEGLFSSSYTVCGFSIFTHYLSNYTGTFMCNGRVWFLLSRRGGVEQSLKEQCQMRIDWHSQIINHLSLSLYWGEACLYQERHTKVLLLESCKQ